MIKDVKRLLLAAIVVFVCSVGLAQTVKIEKITYKIYKGKEAYVDRADADIEVANILSSIDYKGKSYPVVAIGFYYRSLTKKALAFANCAKL